MSKINAMRSVIPVTNNALQCDYEGGPSVSNARSLYERLTGEFIPEMACEGMNEERKSIPNKALTTLNSLHVYPNPATDQLMLELNSFDVNSVYRAKLSSIFGQAIIDQPISDAKSIIPLHGLPGGVYVLLIEKDGRTHASKLIVVNP